MRRRGFESDWKIFETKQAKQKNQLSRKVEHKKLKTTSNESYEALRTNQRLEVLTSEPPPTSLGLEEGNSGSVHVGSVQIATAE